MDSKISAFEIIDLVKKKTQVSQLTQPEKKLHAVNGETLNDNRKRLNVKR